jgi:alpha-tubulin suppressor-like RCC1 family protein
MARLPYLLMFLLACGDDAAPADAGPGSDAGRDAGPRSDAGARDSGAPDAGPLGCTTGCAAVEVTAGSTTSCARRENGEVWCWGMNREGQLGDGLERHSTAGCMNAKEVQFADCSERPVKNLVESVAQVTMVGSVSGCARTTTGEVSCWGYEGLGEFVGAEPSQRFTPEVMPGFAGATDVSDGQDHTCAVVGGNVFCLWNNASGQLGDGTTVERREPVQVPGLSGITDVEASIGAYTDNFTCATNGTEIWCWGSSTSNQLGDGGTEYEECVQGTSRYNCAFSPLAVAMPDGITGLRNLSLGLRHACFSTDAGEPYCWGDNAAGQLGLGDTDGRDVPTLVPGLTGVAQIEAAARHTCARLEDGTVRCWGGNEEGPLGDGLFDHGRTCTVRSMVIDCALSPVTVTGIDDAIDLAVGFEHTCVARESGEVWCWGWNERRQLGDGTRAPQPAPVRVMGF